MPALVGHSHRSTTKTTNKPFKSRKATKGALKEIQKGKVPGAGSNRKTPHQQVMSKLDRRNQNRQKVLTKQRERLREVNIFGGRNGAPRIAAIIPLCDDIDAAAAVHSLNAGLDIDVEVPQEGNVRVDVDRFKQKIQYLILKRDLTACLDACQVADFVLFILSPEQEVDELGELIIRSVESQGLSTVVTLVQGLDKIEPAKRRAGILSSLKSFITHFHSEQEKVHNIDSRQDCANLMRSLCTTTPKGIRWREDRSWMLLDEVQWPENEGEDVVVTGVIRGKGLKADRLVQVGDWGDFQISKITAAPLATKPKGKTEEMATDVTEEILEEPTADQDSLEELAPEEIAMDDVDAISMAPSERRGVLLDDHHYFSEEEPEAYQIPKKVPKGTSNYQSAWYLGEEQYDSGSDYEDDVDMDVEEEAAAPLPQDGMEGLAQPEPTEGAPSEYPQSEMFLDPSPEEEAEQLASYRASKKSEAEEDREFPDEIELHPNVLARERLSRYRGLKSLRSSPWDETEDRAFEPESWRRLLQVPDYKSSRSRVTREALVGGVAPGTRVHVHLKNVPLSVRETYNPSHPLRLFSLLRHEHQRAVLNFNMTLSSDYPVPIRSKEEMIVQCGPRRFVIKPLFSQGGNTPNDVHKFDRFLHPGTSTVATFVGPMIWGSVPALFFKKPTEEALENAEEDEKPSLLVATGTALAPSSSRVIAKRIILAGHPYKIHKKVVTVRYMFFNKEDVEWFKALQLWTKRGRSGYIKESLGTHGYFKATFDGRINPQDSVGVSLYKRMFPREAQPYKGAIDTSFVETKNDDQMEI